MSEGLYYEKVLKLALQRPIFEVNDLNVSRYEWAKYADVMKKLVGINILSDVGGEKYALHSILVKHYLEEIKEEPQWW